MYLQVLVVRVLGKSEGPAGDAGGKAATHEARQRRRLYVRERVLGTVAGRHGNQRLLWVPLAVRAQHRVCHGNGHVVDESGVADQQDHASDSSSHEAPGGPGEIPRRLDLLFPAPPLVTTNTFVRAAPLAHAIAGPAGQAFAGSRIDTTELRIFVVVAERPRI